MREIRKKIILLGSVGVGKTSLIKRFVHQEFSDEYHSTIGVRVDKKTVTFDNVKVHLLIWDLAGEILVNKAYKAYMKGSEGVIGVFDVSRKKSYKMIEENITLVKNLNPNISFKLIGNKIDLVEKEHIDLETFNCDVFSSAKTGENVEQMFHSIALELARKDEEFSRV